MKYKFGDWIITNDNQVGIVVEVRLESKDYFIKFQNGSGKLYFENEIKEWHGCW
jgi:hypothetical protein